MTSVPLESPVTETVSLRDFIERLLLEMDKRYQERFEAQKEAIRVALASQETTHKHTVWIVGTVLAVLQLALHFLPGVK